MLPHAAGASKCCPAGSTSQECRRDPGTLPRRSTAAAAAAQASAAWWERPRPVRANLTAEVAALAAATRSKLPSTRLEHQSWHDTFRYVLEKEPPEVRRVFGLE